MQGRIRGTRHYRRWWEPGLSDERQRVTGTAELTAGWVEASGDQWRLGKVSGEHQSLVKVNPGNLVKV